MRLLEHEAKELLKTYHILVPPAAVISKGDPFDIKGSVVLKPQIPVGGRGKSGAILEASTQDDAQTHIEHLLTTSLRGYKAKKILIEEKMQVKQEFFMAVTYDTVKKSPIAIFSKAGGVDIERLAAREPGKVWQEHFSVQSRLPPYRAREIISETGVTGKRLLNLAAILSKLADIFLDYDATLVEINPLALIKDGRLMALDCHLEIDDDAAFRHEALAHLEEDQSRFEASRQVTEFERKAAEIDKIDHRGVAGRMIEFDGNMGLIIGGGGASLTAFDAVRAHGGAPANYCEIGGNPSVQKVAELTQLILSKPDVQKIAVIMNVVSNTRVDLVARGIIKGILEAGKRPSETVAVFRIPGAWEEEGFKILKKYGIAYCDRTVSIDEAARIAVENSTL
ncbi:MAG: ATP citrate lyase citrate-binding domain-containing protein [Desulfobacterales bacterium]